MSIVVSVIIPTYKRPGLLLRCLSEFLVQNFPREAFEIIVVTDGPDEVTRKEVSNFARINAPVSISCAALPQKAGPAAARNMGAALAVGKLIVFTDDDCLPDRHWLNAFSDKFYKRPEEEIAFSGKTVVPHAEVPTDYEKNIAGLETAEFITANCACTKQAFIKIGGFDEDFPVAWREDSDFQFRLISAGIPIIKVSDAIVVHPVREVPWGISIKEQKKSMYNALLHKKHPALYRERISAEPLWNYYAIVLFAFFTIAGYLVNKPVLATASLFAWLFLVASFTSKRLRNTSRKPSHVVEMIATSMVIPFLSVFWTLYGSFSYKKTLL